MGKKDINTRTTTDLETLYSIYKALPIPTYTWRFVDDYFELIDLNKAALKFVGHQIENIIGVKASSLYHDKPEIITDFKQCVTSQASFERDITYELQNSNAVTFLNVKYIFINSETILVQTEEITHRKQAESKLTEYANQLSLFIQGSPVAVAMFDNEMKYLAFSNKWITDYKLTGKQLIGKSHYEVFPEIGQQWKHIHQRCLKGVTEKKEEDSFVRQDGSTDWIRWEIRPWHKNAGEIGGIIMFTEEITKRKKLEEELVASENRFHLLANDALVGIYILKDGKYTYVNNAMAKIFGYSVAEMIGMSQSQIVHEDDYEKIEHYLLHNSESETAQYYEFSGIHKNKSLLTIQIFGSITEINGKSAIIGTLIDITERKRDEEKIKKDAEKLNNILQNLPVGLSVSSADKKLIFYNNRLTELIGYTIEDIPNLDTWWSVAYPNESYRENVKKEWFEKIEIAKETNSKCEPMQAVIRCKDGSDKLFEGYFAKIGDESITIFQDITELKKAESLLKENNNRILSQNEALIHAKNKIEASEIRLIEAQEAAKVGSWETDLPTLEVIWSEETYTIFELDSKVFQPTHQSFLNQVHPDDKEIVDNAFRNSFLSKDYNSIEHRIITSKGNIKYVEERWKVLFNDNEQPIRVFGTCQDITVRKRVEQELVQTKIKSEENEYRLKLAVEAAKLGIWDWNIKDNVLIWDDRTYEILGLQKGINANVFETWAENLHPEDKERVMEELDAALKGNKKYETTFRIIKPTGEIVHIKADGLVLFDANGIPYRMIGMNSDITEAAQYEEKIKQSEEKLRALIENISDGIVLIDENFNLLYQSPAVQRIVGYTFKDREGKKAIDFIHPDDIQSCLQQYENARKNPGIPVQSQYRTRHKNGNYIWIEVAITNLVDLASVRAYVVIYRDVTERKMFEEKLALSSLILNSSHDAIMSISLDGFITSWNKGAEKVLGYSIEEAVGKSIYLLIPPDLHKEERDFSKSIKNKTLVDRYETTRIRKDGSSINVSITVSPIVDEFGNVIGASKIMRDISIQKSIELEKIKIMNDLIQRNRDLEQFAYIVSHNLRAPVANIMGISNLMMLPKNDLAEKEQMVTALNKSIGAMDTVIKDLNHILQIKREINEQKTLVKFSELLIEIKLSISHLINKEQVKFITDFSAVDEMVTIRSYLYSIFYNLITNSIKYKQPNVNPIIEIKTVLAGNKIEIIFRDNGLGIDLEKKGEQIFGLYKRFHFHIEGKGMGLFMVKTQVETLGGNIYLRSEINKGTEFKIELEL